MYVFPRELQHCLSVVPWSARADKKDGCCCQITKSKRKEADPGRHLRQMVTQGFSYNGHATGFDGWENCSKAKTTWCCISLQCTVSFLSVAVEYGSFLTCAPRVEEVTTIHSNLIQCDRYRYRYGRMIKFIDAHCHYSLDPQQFHEA